MRFTGPVLFLLLLWPRASIVPQAPAPRTELTAAIRAAVIDSAAQLLVRRYVEADTGRLLADHLKARLRARSYDGLDQPGQFAEAVTRDLRALNGDLHLGLRYVPGGLPAGGYGPDPVRQNFGITRAEVLEGNVGYLEISGFLGAPGYRDAVVEALQLLSRTDAMIIDLRRNGGGSGEMSHFVFSHFLGATPVPTIRVTRRPPGRTEVRQSLAIVPGPRRTDVPLFVLTSQGTASAAEEFSFVLRNQGRATIVGTRTAGAGHMVATAPVGHDFVVSVSITRVADPSTGQEWEQVGVAPDRAVPAWVALPEAHAAALRAIDRQEADSARRVLLARLIETADARRQPVPVPLERLARLAGNYEGSQVELVDGKLRFARRAGGLGEELVPLGNDRFAMAAARLGFEERDGVTYLTMEQPNGTRVTWRRTDG
ncbi:MAG TPA: S41 family peptidase [Gemmatimonadales bacterium]